eukprot:6188608-Pleurochrysis_carterae.AAC.2
MSSDTNAVGLRVARPGQSLAPLASAPSTPCSRHNVRLQLPWPATMRTSYLECNTERGTAEHWSKVGNTADNSRSNGIKRIQGLLVTADTSYHKDRLYYPFKSKF